jgi:hypothetical protein
LSDYSHTALILGTLDMRTGIVASALAISWARLTRSGFDKDMTRELIKIFMGGAVVCFVLSQIYVYSVD